MQKGETITPEILASEDNEETFELDINAIFALQNDSQTKFKTLSFVSNIEAEESLHMIEVYCQEILGQNIDLSTVQKGGIYYLKAEKTVTKIHEYRNSIKSKDGFVKVQGNNSVLSTYGQEEEDEPQFYTYLIFIVHATPLRRQNSKHQRICQLLMLTSNIFIICVKKNEKGINLEDFIFLSRLFELGHIEDCYNGEEKYKEFFAAMFLLYFNYHKEIKVDDQDNYFIRKLDSRKANKLDRFTMMKGGMKSKLPYIGFQGLVKTNYPKVRLEAMQKVAWRFENIVQECFSKTFNGATLVSVFYEATDALNNGRIFYLKNIYRSAIMSQARKIVDKFQSETYERIDNTIREDEMPLEDTLFEDVMFDFERNLKEEMSSDEFKKLQFSAGFKYYEDLKHNVKDFIEQKKEKNSKSAEKLAKTLVNTILEQIPEVNGISEKKLRSPLVFDNFENTVMDLLQSYYRNISGSMKFKFIAELMPPFLLDYCKTLHKKVLLSKEHLINDLKEKNFDFEYQISNLKEKIENQENSFIASEKEKRNHQSELDKKDLKIKQIENKLNLEKKLSNSKINQLEAQLKTRDENISMLKRELEKFKYDFKRVQGDFNDKQRESMSLSRQLQSIQSSKTLFQKMRSVEMSQEDGDLSEVWETVKNVKKNIEGFSKDLEKSMMQKDFKLQTIIQEKDKRILDITQDSGKRINMLKNEHKSIVKNLRLEHEIEMDQVKMKTTELEEKEFQLNQKLIEFDTVKMVNSKLEIQITELQNLVQALTRDKDAKEDLIKMEKEVISTFVHQVESKEKARMEVAQELAKLKDFKKKHRHDKLKLLGLTQEILLKYVKKKKDNINGAWHELTPEDKDAFLKMLTEIKININKYIQ